MRRTGTVWETREGYSLNQTFIAMKPGRLPSSWGALFAAFLLLVFAAAPAAAQRSRTGGERKTEKEEKEEKRSEPETRPARRTPETAPAPRREPETQPAPAPETQPAPREQRRGSEQRGRTRAPEATPPAPQTQPAPQPRSRTPEARTGERERGETPRGDVRARPDQPRTSNGGRDGSSAGREDGQRTTERGRAATSGNRTYATGDRQGRIVGNGGRTVGNRVERGAQHRPRRDAYRWHHVPAVPHRGYHYRPAAPVVLHLAYEWPWEQRYRRAWSPRYRYRQVVHVESGYGRDRWTSRLEVRTTYRQRVRHASRNRAELDLDIEAVELYQDGRYLGRVNRIPNQIGRVQATVRRNGRISFNRDVFVVGSREVGFEIVATRAYDGYFLSDWRRDDDLDVARLDLRRGRAERVRYSRLLDYDGFRGYAPVSLLPEDERWLGDYGPYAVSTYAYDDDFYDSYGYDDGYYYGYESGATPRYDVGARGETAGTSPTLQGESDDTYETPSGARIRLRREAEIQRLE